MAGPQSYVLHNDREIERLEAQATIAGIADHLRHCPVPDQATILDAGCGSGSMSRMLAHQHPDATVIGVDLNPNYLAGARALAAQAGLDNVSFEEGDLQALPFSDARFDLVWTKYVLYFLSRPAAAIAEFRRVLRPGGAAVIVLNDWTGIVLDPPDASLNQRLQIMVRTLIGTSLPRHLASALREAGFASVTVELETDRVYTSIGEMTEDQCRNHRVELLAARPYIFQPLGGDAAFDTFVSDWLAFLARPDTAVVLPLWFVRGSVAA